MRIRRATTADIPAIVTLATETWPGTYHFAGPDFIAHGLATWWSPDAVARSLDTTTVLVATTPAVTAIGNIDLRGDTAIIWKLYVLPSAQGTGIGGTLLDALITTAGDRPVELGYVDGNDRAARFYATHGFSNLRREPGYEPGFPDTVWLRR